MADFEVYQRDWSKGGKTAESGLFVTVTRRGFFALSRDLYAALGSPGAVRLLSDRKERAAALRPARRGEEGAYLVGSRSRTVSAVAFCRFLELDYSVARRYPVTMDGGLAVFEVSVPGTVVTSNRARNGT